MLFFNINYMANITFNLDPNFIEFIKVFAKEKGITQREVIEMSLEQIKKQKMIENIRAESQNLWKNNSPELLSIAESWLYDYNNWLRILENGK